MSCDFNHVNLREAGGVIEGSIFSISSIFSFLRFFSAHLFHYNSDKLRQLKLDFYF